MKQSKESITMKKQHGEPGGKRRPKKFNVNPEVSHRFAESLRVKVEDSEESEEEDLGDPIDPLGEEMARLLNQSYRFQRPQHFSASFGEDNEFSIQPLLSSRNWRWLKNRWSWLKEDSTSHPRSSVSFAARSMWNYLFGKTKPFFGALRLFFWLSLFALSSSAAVVTLSSLWSLNILSILIFFALSILVDFKDLLEVLPKEVRSCFNRIKSTVKWIDDTVLLRKRYQGREWNKEDFEWKDPKSAESSSQQLWGLPPPSVNEGKLLCLDEKHLERDEWSKDTTQHILAIDYCFLMLREAFLRKQYRKLRKAVLKNIKTSDPVLSSSAYHNDGSIARTLELDQVVSNHSGTFPSKTGTKDNAKRFKSLQIDVSTSSDDEDYGSHFHQGKSPIDAVEAIQRHGAFLFDSLSPLENRKDDFLSDKTRFPALNNILEEELLDSQASPAVSKDRSMETNSEGTGDLNWMDVGAEIGLKILGSAAVQKVMASHDTAEKINEIKENVESQIGANNLIFSNEESLLLEENEVSQNNDEKRPIALPVHSMWTSASAAAGRSSLSKPNSPESQPPLINIPGNPEDHPTQSPPRIQRLTFDPNAIESANVEVENIETNGLIQRVERTDANENVAYKIPTSLMTPRRSPRKKAESSASNYQRTKSVELLCNQKNGVVSPLARTIASTAGKDTTSPIQNVAKRSLLLPGMKVAVPMFPLQPNVKPTSNFLTSHYQMATVVSSKRLSIYAKNKSPPRDKRGCNCLSVTVKLDKSFLRNGEFAELTFRVMDEWGPRYMPKHSKLPLGSCVSTSFGLGVLVGWRVEDDMHIVRSLWQRRGAGSACAYLARDAIHSTMEAAVGFGVDTSLGRGNVVAYTGGGRDFRYGHYLVKIKEDGKHHGQIVELNRSDILSCRSAQFIPIIEHITEAAKYQLQVDNYTAALKGKSNFPFEEPFDGKSWQKVSRYSDILWKSFLRAIEEDEDFDAGMNEFITSIIKFFDKLDAPSKVPEYPEVLITPTANSQASKLAVAKQEAGLNVFMKGVFGIFGGHKSNECDEPPYESIEVEFAPPNHRLENTSFEKSYDRAFAIIRTLMRTVSIARAACVEEPNFKLALSICYEFLLFARNVLKVQQKNVSPDSLEVWQRAWEEIESTFGPVKDRLQKIGEGIAERMEKQGRRAKVRLLRFADKVVQDDILLQGIQHGDWDTCGERIESAMVESKIIDEENREHYRKTAQFIYNHFAAASARSQGAAERNNAKLVTLAKAVQCIAAPRRSILKLFLHNEVLDVLERILVRVFHKDDVASQMLSIHASNFHTLRQFRLLKDFTVAGKLWMPFLDAADGEISSIVSIMPENAQDLLIPLSSLFSLCVVQFHKIGEGDLTTHWLDFLMEEEAVAIIHDIDLKLILMLESFARDVNEMMVVLPYYPSIEDDILNLVDEVDLDEFLKEASDAIDDEEKLAEFLQEKAIIAIERFLDYLPKMSIPVEKRDLTDGWVLTCRDADGGDLTLTDLTIKRENLICQVLGGDTIFFPKLKTDEDGDCISTVSAGSSTAFSIPPRDAISPYVTEASSVLDLIRDMFLQAQRQGCWKVGVGGVESPPTDRYVASVMQGLCVTRVFDCAIELWRNLEIDDDELLEIAIKDVSYQIQLQHEGKNDGENKEYQEECPPTSVITQTKLDIYGDRSEPPTHRYNPRIDPTVLFLEIKKLTFQLDKFFFRIEKHESRRTIFDPAFEGHGNLLVRNVSIKIRVECVKQVIQKMGLDVLVPMLHLRELDVQLERVKLKVKDTGADWLLNKVVKGFEENITQILSTNLIDQVKEQLDHTLESLNGYFEVNPDVLLGILGITMEDLEVKEVWV